MVSLIDKKELPMVAYNPAMIKDELVMFSPLRDGVAAYFPALDQIRFMPYKDILEYMSGAELEEKEMPAESRKKPKPVNP
jgi:hypothetical protein